MKLFKQVFILCLYIIMISCSTENNDEEDDEITQGEAEALVKQFIGDECFSALKELDFKVRGGTNSPNTEGGFLIDPAEIRVTSNLGNIELGEEEEVVPFLISNTQQDGDFEFTWLFFQNEKITNTLYTGSGNEFSMFFFFDFEEDDTSARLTFGFSGIINEKGVEEGQFFLCQSAFDEMNGGTNNSGNTGGLLFFDGDGLIERF